MKIYFLCPLWGSENLPFEKFVSKVKDAGYDGVEISLPLEDDKAREGILSVIERERLLFVGQHWETLSIDFQNRKEEYLHRLHNLAVGKPLLIDSQTGRDIFSFEQNMELVEAASTFTRETDVPVVHETHRGRFSFTAHLMKRFLEANTSMRIGADFSHWCNVAESLLDDQEDAMEIAISRSHHIHARVGFAEGPQIPDPSAVEWKDVLTPHISWWDRIIQRARREGRKFFTITPEFGPYPYMTILPHTKAPITDQWEANVFMMNTLRERYFKLGI